MLTDLEKQGIEAFKSLSAADRCAILAAISKSVWTPAMSANELRELLESTGHLEVAMACYSAYLRGTDFWG